MMAGYSPGGVASLLATNATGPSNAHLAALFSPSESAKQVVVPKFLQNKPKQVKVKNTKLDKEKTLEQKAKKKKKKQLQESNILFKRESALRQADNDEDKKSDNRKKRILEKKKKALERYQEQLAEEKAAEKSVPSPKKGKLNNKSASTDTSDNILLPKKSKKIKTASNETNIRPESAIKDSLKKKSGSGPIKADKSDNDKGLGKEGRKEQREHRKFKKAKDKRTVFVGNLPIAVTKKALLKLFSKYGTVESVRLRCAAPGDPKLPKKAIVITKTFHKDRHNINAYVVFEKQEAAKEAIKANGTVVDGMKIRVDLAKNSNKHDNKRSIFVGNLPFGAEEDPLRQHFEDCGTIENVRIIRDARTGIGKGFGYILFDSKDAVSFALKLDGEKFNERALRVQEATTKPTKEVDTKGQKHSSDQRKNNQQEGPPAKKRKFTLPSNVSAAAYQGVVATKFRIKKKKQKNMQKKKVKFAKLKESKKENGETNRASIPGKSKGKPPKQKPFTRNKIPNKKTTKGR